MKTTCNFFKKYNNKILHNNSTVLFNTLQVKYYRNFRLDDYNFRDHRFKGGIYPSPYVPQFTLTEEEKIANDKLPINERVLDYSKYMHHKGEIKPSAGAFQKDVEPFPRIKIMMLCNIINDLIKEFDQDFIYIKIIQEYIKFVMEVVDEHEVLIEIEQAFPQYTNVEEFIESLHNEVLLLRKFLQNNIYKDLMDKYKKHSDEDIQKESSFLSSMMFDKSIINTGEGTLHRKHNKPEKFTSDYSY